MVTVSINIYAVSDAPEAARETGSNAGGHCITRIRTAHASFTHTAPTANASFMHQRAHARGIT